MSQLRWSVVEGILGPPLSTFTIRPLQPQPSSGTSWLVGVALLGLLASCKSADPVSTNNCPVGAQWCDCTPAGTCDPGLSCVRGTSATGKDTSCRAPSGTSDPNPERPVPPAQSSGDRLDGLYSGGSSDFLYLLYYFFGRDGRLLIGKPAWRSDGGLDFEASTTKPGVTVARYRMEAASLVVVPPSGPEKRYDTYRTRTEDLGFRVDGRNFTPHRPCALKTFDGTFIWKTGAPLNQYGVLHHTGIALTPSGRFIYSNVAPGATAAAPTSPDTDGDNVDTKGVEGSYRIQGLLMTLTFDAGHVMQDLFQCGEAEPTYFSWGSKIFAIRE